MTIFLCCIFMGYSKAQKNWTYNFGGAKGNVNTTKNSTVAVSSTSSHKLLPIPADMQVARFRVGNNKGDNGGFDLVNLKDFGTGASLAVTSPDGGSTNKFSISGIDGTALFSVGFKVKLKSGSKGTYKFAIGKDPGLLNASGIGYTPFSNNLNFSSSATLPTFLILQWDISASGYQLSVQQKDKRLIALDSSLNPAVSFSNGKDYNIQIYANNTLNEEIYTINSTSYTVAAGASHIWINNHLLLNAKGNANFITSELAENEVINSLMFLSLNTDNAEAYFDDFNYANYISKERNNKPSPIANKQIAPKNIDSIWGLGSIETYQKTASLFSKVDKPDPERLKVLSCNILKGFSGDKSTEQAFQKWITDRKPDVVAIQEMNGFTQKRLEEFAGKMGFPYAVMHKEEGYPLGLISKYPISNVKKVTEGMRHGILYGKILDYHFVVTHLVSYTYQQRIKEIDNVLLKFVDGLPKDEKMIMMGDFNNMSPEDSQFYDNNPNKIQLLINSEKNNPGNSYLNAGKIDYTVIHKVLNAGFYDTYKIFNKHYDKSAPTKMKNHNNYTRIDYIWVNKYAKPDCLDMFIVKDDFTDYMSDHYPTMLVLKREK